jgi:hypothetical protein
MARAKAKRLKDLKPIPNASVSGALAGAVSRGPSIRKTKPRATPSTIRNVKPRKPRTIGEVAQAQRVQESVDRARSRPKAKADTGDILKGTKRKPPKGRRAEGLKRELEGSGHAVRLSGKLADVAVKSPQIDLPTKVANALIPGLGGLEKRIVKDIVNLPAQAVPSLYVPIAGLAEYAQGRPKRLEQLGRDIKKTDPVYAAGEAVVKGASGDVKGAKKAGSRAVKLAKEHPGFAGVELIGLKGTGGRAVTRGQELAGKRPTRREPATVPGTDLRQERSYSKDVFTRRGQKLTERNRLQTAQRERAEAAALEREDPSKHADRIDEKRAKADQVDPTRMSDREVRKRAAERVAVNEVVRRENRTRVGQEVVDATAPRPGRFRPRTKPTAATTLGVQGIVDFTPRDLARYKNEIAAQYEGLSGAGRKANRQLQAQVQRAIDKGADPEALRASARAYGKIVKPRQKALVERGLLPAAAAEKAPLVPYAVRKMGAKPTEEGPIDIRTGEPIKTPAIRAHMKAHGVDEPSYVSQSPSRGGSSAYYVSSAKPQSIPGSKRTGGATVKGTFDAHPDVLAENAARSQGLIDAADGFKNAVHEFAHKPTLGRLQTKRDADSAARELAAETGVKYRPVRINPFAGREEQLQALLDKPGEGLDQPSGRREPVREAMQSAFQGEDGPGPWALIPDAAADEFASHTARMGVGPAAKVGQLVGQSFRRAVLSTSPSWFAGNLVEATLRTSLAGAGPRSLKLGNDVLKAVDEISPQLGQELRARAVGGGHFKSADALHVRRGAEQFEGTTLQPLARGLAHFWQTPGPKQAAQVWHQWTDVVFRQLNGRIESKFQTAMLGRALRDSHLMDPELPRLSKTAVEQAARGLLDTNEQAALGRAVERMYGKYNGFNAGTRWAIAMYTPFIPWTLNAVKFVFDVLPRDHPTVTGLIAATEQWTEEWRKDHGLDLFMEEAVPGFLQGSIPTSGGGHQRAPHRYTPFGAFGDPLDTVAKSVLPQYAGVLAAFKGEDWKGSPLRNKDGTEMDVLGKAGIAAQSFAEATVPLLGIVKRVALKGPQALNPAAVTKSPKSKARARVGSGIDAELDAALGGGGDIDSQLDAALGGTP